MANKAQSFNVGNFIAGYKFKDCFVVGVVTSIEEDYLVKFYDFLRQVPCTNTNTNFFFLGEDLKKFDKVSKKKALRFLQERWDRFEEEIKAGGLTGALASREQYSLDQTVSCIEGAKDPTVIENKVIEVPRTGIYVLEGGYLRRSDRRFLDGFEIEPRWDEELVKEFMNLFYKGGTENIPSSYNGRELNGYEVTEIPEKGTRLVKPRLVIDINKERVS